MPVCLQEPYIYPQILQVLNYNFVFCMPLTSKMILLFLALLIIIIVVAVIIPGDLYGRNAEI